MAESEEELKSLLMTVKEGSEKARLKRNIRKMKIMASGPITSWDIDGETVETEREFIFLGSKITADGDCSHEIKRHLFLGRKAMTNLDSILKSRDITLPTKVSIIKAFSIQFSSVAQSCRLLVTPWTAAPQASLSISHGFPVAVHGCESWTTKKAELTLLNCGVREDS